MNRDGNTGHFNRLYYSFSAAAGLLILGYAGCMMYMTGLMGRVIWLSILFICIFAMLCVLLIWGLRSKLAGIVDTLDEIIEGAIRGKGRVTGYSETSISSLENKLIRYIDLSFAHEQKMEVEKNTIKQLISDISHQTKTPLSNITLYSQLLAEQAGFEGETQQWVEQISIQANKLDWLIQSLIKMSRLETGIITIHPSHSPVIGTITEAMSQAYKQAEQKGIDVTIDCASSIYAYHDQKWTGEALFNILDNAVKYSEPGSRIRISVATYELFVRVDIADSGMGIAECELTHIFKRFYRCQRTAGFEGVGIGLFLTREIISAQGGYIKVSSKLEQGTTFSIFLLADN